jgi:hypothetical protein
MKWKWHRKCLFSFINAKYFPAETERNYDNLVCTFCTSICRLFNDAISKSDSIASNDSMIVNNEFEMISTEAVMAWFNVWSDIWLEILRKITKSSFRIVGIPAEIRIWRFPRVAIWTNLFGDCLVTFDSGLCEQERCVLQWKQLSRLGSLYLHIYLSSRFVILKVQRSDTCSCINSSYQILKQSIPEGYDFSLV